MISKRQAMELKHDTIIFQIGRTNVDGTPAQWKAVGRCKTWKRDSNRFSVPIKHKIYGNMQLTNENRKFYTLDERIAKSSIKNMNHVRMGKSLFEL